MSVRCTYLATNLLSVTLQCDPFTEVFVDGLFLRKRQNQTMKPDWKFQETFDSADVARFRFQTAAWTVPIKSTLYM